MARLVTSGFESGGFLTEHFAASSPTNGTIVTSPVRTGTYAMRINASSADNRLFFNLGSAGAPTSGFAIRAYIYISTEPSGETAIISHSSIAWVTLDSSRQLRLYDEDGQIGSASSALNAATWYMVELRTDISPSAGSDQVAARLDGVEFASSVTRSISFSGGSTVEIGVNVNGETRTADIYFDDIAINDLTGSYENTWPGDGSIIYLRPNGAGDSAATTGTYADIDELLFNDATDYIELDNHTTIADYTVDDPVTAGIASDKAVKLVQLRIRMREESATISSYTKRIKSASGGTVNASSAYDSTTTWRTDPSGSTEWAAFHVAYTDPTTGSPWTVTGTNSLSNMQIGVANSDTNPADDIFVTALWAAVEFTDAAPVADANSGYLFLYGAGS